MKKGRFGALIFFYLTISSNGAKIGACSCGAVHNPSTTPKNVYIIVLYKQ